MKAGLFPYFLRQALVNIKNNLGVHVLGLGTMVVSLLIFGSFLLLMQNFNIWIQNWGNTLSMSVYLKDDIKEIERDRIATFLEKMPHAEIQRYISKETALTELRNALGSKAILLDGLSKNPLPASFEVLYKTQEGQEINPQAMKEVLENFEGVTEAQYSAQWLKRFDGWIQMVRLTGFIIGGLLCMGVMFITTNTIKLTIYSRRDEIEILKLVGATDWFVKIPFILEGTIQGFIGGLLSLLTLFAGYVILSAKKVHVLGLVMLDFVFIPPEYTLLILLISIFLGLVASFIALGRFFEV